MSRAGGRRPTPSGARVVVKAGSSSLVTPGGELDPEALVRTVDHVESLWESGRPTVLVSSGAVAAGLPALGHSTRPKDLPGLQVAAAVGQGRLMERYAALFAQRGLVAGQVLLTKDVLARRVQYLHARGALERMLDLGVVPIVNENDTVAVDELRLGDNDRLAAVVAQLVRAGLLVILTDTGGLYSADPRTVQDVELLGAVHASDQALDQAMSGGAGPLGSGGAATKVAAARIAAWSGIPTVIADARAPQVVMRAVDGEEIGTWVAPHRSRLPARKLWIAFGQPSVGSVVVDRGAARALVEGGRSLLAVGVVSVQGRFDAEAAVEVVDETGKLIGKGLVAMASIDLDQARGRHSSEVGGVVIHRDDFVPLVTGAEAADSDPVDTVDRLAP